MVRHGAHTDIGLHRARNEDRCIADPAAGLFGVADGVGGLPGGGEAAQKAHDSVLAGLRRLEPDTAPDLTRLFEIAHRDVVELGRRLSPATSIATTMTLGLFWGGRITVGHVGDSRCYGWRGGRLEQISRDHSEGHALTRCLGQREPLRVDLIVRELVPGDRFLFCTDGLSNAVPDRDIGQILGRDHGPDVIAQQLVGAALAGGGGDNISVVVVQVP